LDSGIDIRLECKSLIRKAARNDKNSGGLKTGNKPEDDGIRMNGIVYAGYAYYGWYADKDYLSDTKVHVLVTFKEVNGKLSYYANSSVGITPQDVR
ncbi:MAG: hypothetical protein IJR58_00270, partial [Lachnospiraceae bacterium]|nr:hypothetical protein [Lachnospiraceae bacterium]